MGDTHPMACMCSRVRWTILSDSSGPSVAPTPRTAGAAVATAELPVPSDAWWDLYGT